MSNKLFGLADGAKERLMERLLRRRAAESWAPPEPDRSSFRELPAFRQLELQRQAGETLGIENPYFRVHDGRAGGQSRIGNRSFVNFASYNYLGLSGHPAVNEAAAEALRRYGTSASASRLVSGERPIHGELEAELAALHGTEAALVFVSGHATNVTTIATLTGPRDLVVHDAYMHNSGVQGAIAAGARRMAFPHNDHAALDRMLIESRSRFQNVLVLIEGLYSMDGDAPDLAGFAEVARRHGAWLMVDEAHSVGTLGPAGRGIAAAQGVSSGAADIWMGTLSKALAGCGGWIAGSRDLIDLLRFSAPGFVYSVAMPPSMAAASLAALRLMLAEPERAERLRGNSRRFLEAARSAGLDTGRAQGVAIVPVIAGGSVAAARLSSALFEQGVNVQPILAPAVPEDAARLRFFLSSEHEAAEIDEAVAATADAKARTQDAGADLAALALRLGFGR